MTRFAVKNILLLIFTLLINIFLFLFIPFLSQIKDPGSRQKYKETPVYMAKTRIDSPQEKKQSDPEPEKEKDKPKYLKMKRVNPDSLKKPKFDLTTPKFKFDFSKLKLGSVKISAPLDLNKNSKPGPINQDFQGNFELGEVDQNPRLISRFKPIYPFWARNRNITGKVILKFLVNKNGEVEQIKVLKAEPEGVFEESSKNAVTKWRFEPGVYQGQPVNTWVTVPIRYQLSD
jgi:protein TonB